MGLLSSCRSVPVRGASRSSSKRGVGCGGRWMSGLNATRLRSKAGIRGRTEIDADASGGRSKCMPARQLARSGRGRRKRQFPVSDEQAAKSIRVRNAGEDLRPRPGSAHTLFGDGLDHCPCADGMRDARIKTCGRRGRGETPCRSARPYGGQGTRRPASPGAGQHTGVDARLPGEARLVAPKRKGAKAEERSRV